MTDSAYTTEIESYPQPSNLKTIDWTNFERAYAQLIKLTEAGEIKAFFVRISPETARGLLEATQLQNRPKRDTRVARIAERIIGNGQWEITGDTIKFDVNGDILDGQHRLSGCAQSDQDIVTLVVVNLPTEIFDVLDSGGAGNRTAADAIELAGYAHAKILAAALETVRRYDQGGLSNNGGASGKMASLTPREARLELEVVFHDLKRFVDPALAISRKAVIPAAKILACLYLIGRKVPAHRKLALEFADAWLSDDRAGRNAVFLTLFNRIAALKREGVNHRAMMISLILTAFNFWQAGVAPHPRVLNWRPGVAVPRIYYNGADFLDKSRRTEQEKSGIDVEVTRVVKALSQMINGDGAADAMQGEIASAANVHQRSVPTLVAEAERAGFLGVVHMQSGRRPARYVITARGKKLIAESDIVAAS